MTRTEEIMEMANDHALAYSLDADWRRTHDKLKSAIEELVKDAERYQWLRGQHWSTSHMCVVIDPTKNVLLGAVCPSIDMLDEAVDAAMETTP